MIHTPGQRKGRVFHVRMKNTAFWLLSKIMVISVRLEWSFIFPFRG